MSQKTCTEHKKSRYIINLMDYLKPLSHAQTWKLLTQEWSISHSEVDEECSTTCVCGKDHLKYIFYMKNEVTRQFAGPIGSECIKQFDRKDLNDDLQRHEDVLKKRRLCGGCGQRHKNRKDNYCNECRKLLKCCRGCGENFIGDSNYCDKCLEDLKCKQCKGKISSEEFDTWGLCL